MVKKVDFHDWHSVCQLRESHLNAKSHPFLVLYNAGRYIVSVKKIDILYCTNRRVYQKMKTQI
jgi:hypothetical protein